MEDLFTEVQLGKYMLDNRICMAPLTRMRSDRLGEANSLMAEYYAQRASAGLIISEATNISPMACGYANTPGIFNQLQIESWKEVTEKVHRNGGFIFCQLWHVGRHSHPGLLNGNTPLAPSAVRERGHVTTYSGKQETVMPESMTPEQIRDTVKDYGIASLNAIKAGFDGVEIHGANGYLIDQFIQDGTNRRTDRYGGTVQNRIRFALEVVEECCQQIGADRVGIRLSPSGIKLDMCDSNPKKTFGLLVRELNNYNLAYLHLLEPWFDVSERPDYVLEVARHFREIYTGKLIANNGFDFEKANRYIEQGIADLVSFGKLYISNPDLVERFRTNAPLNAWKEEYFYRGGAKGYTDYPIINA